MARNEEKHFCNLNRLILLKEKEDYEKANPARPRLNTLYTPEDIQKWLPSIKKDIDFYLKKSQVTCYSDAHIEECREKIVKLEKEFKAFVRKIKQLAPSPSDVIPWTSRPYKRKKINEIDNASSIEFKRIATPILDMEKTISPCVPNDNEITLPRVNGEKNNYPSLEKEDCVSQYDKVNWNLMDQPLMFSNVTTNNKNREDVTESYVNLNISDKESESCDLENTSDNCNDMFRSSILIKSTIFNEAEHCKQSNQTNLVYSIVNYDSSDDETV